MSLLPTSYHSTLSSQLLPRRVVHTARFLTASSVSPSARSYFVQVNLDMNLLVRDSRGRSQVDKIALIGFETLWDMCLHTRNSEVLEKATSLFIWLHENVRHAHAHHPAPLGVMTMR